MEREVIELEIGPDGEVEVHVKGKKGDRCLDIRDLFRTILGPVKATALTDEYYERQNLVSYKQAVSSRKR